MCEVLCPPDSTKPEPRPPGVSDAPAGDLACALTLLAHALGVQAAGGAWASAGLETGASTGATNGQV